MRSETKQIFKAMSGYSIGIFIAQASPLLTLPVVLKNLYVEQYGELGRVVSWVLLYAALGSLSIHSSNFRFFRHHNINFSKTYNQKLIGSSNIVIAFGVTISLLVAVFLIPDIYLLPTLLFILSQTLYTYVISLTRLANKIFYFNCCEIGRQLIYILGLFFLIRINFFNVYNIIILLGIMNLPFIFILMFCFSRLGWIKLVYSRRMLKATLLYALPLLIAFSGQIFLQQSPILFHSGSTFELGVINYSNKIALMIFIFQAVIFLAWPTFAFKFQNEKIHQTIFNFITIMLMGFMWSVYLFYEELTMLIAGSDYLASKNSTIGFLVAYCLSVTGNFIDTSAAVHKKTKIISLIFIFGLVILYASYHFLDQQCLGRLPYLPLLLSFSSMMVLRIVIYKYKKMFIPWDNRFLFLLVISCLILLRL